jgi:uncharacterized sulfatase
MERRDFLTTLVAGATAAVTAGCAGAGQTPMANVGTETGPEAAAAAQSSGSSATPNIIFIMADELRYPMHFPAGIHSADEFMARYMPNVYKHLWQGGVVFTNHQTAAGACSPSRGVWVTGLYAHQTWLVTTVGAGGTGAIPPSLEPAFPTYGQLLRQAGYDVPYIGKFHVSSTSPYSSDRCGSNIPQASNYLAPYGFDTYVCPDPAGSQGQGVSCDGGCVGDPQVADTAIGWLSARSGNTRPFCLTVSFVNPHDQEYFWGGTEPTTYMGLFNGGGQTPLVAYDTTITSLDNPPPQGFPAIPSNWESFASLGANKPSSQVMFNEGLQAIYGATSFDPAATAFALEPSLILKGRVFKGVAPYSYWQRVQDSYVQIIQLVDQQIGRVLDAIPADIRANSKVGTVYKETMNVPLIVRDYTGGYAGDVGAKRAQLTSSVDMLRLLVTLGHGGSSSWITGDLATLYANRHDLLAVVRSNAAAGRTAAFYTTDENVQVALNYNGSPEHILGMITAEGKLGVYSYFQPGTTTMATQGREVEYYDYGTAGGREELDNQSGSSAAAAMLELLLESYLPDEIEAPLPAALVASQNQARQNYLAYVSVIDNLPTPQVALSFGADALPQ